MGAFAAIKKDGSAITRGDSSNGGEMKDSTSSELTSDVKKIYSTTHAFTALKNNCSVVTWGLDYLYGTAIKPKDKLSGTIKDIVTNSGAYAALKENGSVVT